MDHIWTQQASPGIDWLAKLAIITVNWQKMAHQISAGAQTMTPFDVVSRRRMLWRPRASRTWEQVNWPFSLSFAAEAAGNCDTKPREGGQAVQWMDGKVCLSDGRDGLVTRRQRRLLPLNAGDGRLDDFWSVRKVAGRCW